MNSAISYCQLKMNNKIFLAENCKTTDSSLLIMNFLNHIAPMVGDSILQSTVLSNRKDGLTGYLLSDNGHITVHTFSDDKRIMLEILAYGQYDTDKVQKAFIRQWGLDVKDVKLFTSNNEEKIECDEPGCVRMAATDWHGRHVCKDHFDHYRDQEMNLRMEQDYR